MQLICRACHAKGAPLLGYPRTLSLARCDAAPETVESLSAPAGERGLVSTVDGSRVCILGVSVRVISSTLGIVLRAVCSWHDPSFSGG